MTRTPTPFNVLVDRSHETWPFVGSRRSLRSEIATSTPGRRLLAMTRWGGAVGGRADVAPWIASERVVLGALNTTRFVVTSEFTRRSSLHREEAAQRADVAIWGRGVGVGLHLVRECVAMVRRVVR